MLVNTLEVSDGTYIRVLLDDLVVSNYIDPVLEVETERYVLNIQIYWVGKRARRGGGRMYSVRLQYSGKTGQPFQNKQRESFLKTADTEAARVDSWVKARFRELVKFGKSNPFRE